MIMATCPARFWKIRRPLVRERKEMQERVQLIPSGEYDVTDKERLETLLSPAMAARGSASVQLLGLSKNLRRLFQIADLNKLFEFVS
jgi:hypothetical protein